MPNFYTQEFISEECLKRDILLISDYKSSQSHIKVKCLKCDHIWNSLWNNIQQKHGCPKCEKLIPPDIESIKELALTKGFKILSDKYINSRTHLNAECLKCGYTWIFKWGALRDDQTGCKNCAGLIRLSLEFVKTEALKVGIIINSDYYKNNTTRLDVKCTKCQNIWETSWGNIKNNHNCPKCAGQRSKPQEDIFEFVKVLYPDSVMGSYGILTDKHLQLDIWIPSIKKAIEYDGPSHDPDHRLFKYYTKRRNRTQLERDLDKNKECKNFGIELLRVSYKNWEKSNKLWILLCIKSWLEEPNENS